MPQIDQLIKTKFYTPPVRQDIVPRPRLIAQLNSGLHRKLSLVSAPAGFGKTTLVSSWLHQQERPFSWISLDEDDNDLRVFFTYVIAALQRIDSNIGNDILLTIQASQALQVPSLLTMMVNEIDAMEKGIILVLDDYHRITNRAVHEALDFLIEHMPARMHLVIMGRVDPDISQSRLRVNREMIEIRSNDLRFTQEEATSFLNELMNLNLSPGDIAALEKRTEGWIAGLQLAALSLQGRKDKHAFVNKFSGSHYYIIDYLVEEVLALQPEEIRTFLCDTSILERFCAPLCDAVLGISNSRHILPKLESSNLFLIPLDDELYWFRYHHLFADFLETCLREKPGEYILNLHNRAAEWHQQHGLIHQALYHYLEAKDLEKAASLIEPIGMKMLTRSEFDTLSGWLDSIPEEFMYTRPWLCIYKAWILRRIGQMDNVEQLAMYAEKAIQGIDIPADSDQESDKIGPLKKSEEQAIRGQIASLRAFVAIHKGEIQPSIEFGYKALRLLPPRDITRGVTGLILGIATRSCGNLQGSEEAFSEAQLIGRASGNMLLTQILTWHLGVSQYFQGQLHRAYNTFRETLTPNYELGGHLLPYAAHAHVEIAKIAYEWNDLKTAKENLEASIKIAEPADMIDAQIDSYVTKARIHLALGDLNAALEAYHQAEQKLQAIPNPDIITHTKVNRCKIQLYLAQGDILAAEHQVREHRHHLNRELGYVLELMEIIYARVFIACGNKHPEGAYLVDASDLLVRFQKLAEVEGWIIRLIEILILKALVLQAMDKNEPALKTLSKALSLAEPEGYVRTFVDEGPPMKTLLWKAVSRGIYPRYAGRLLGTLESEVQDETVETQLMPESRMIEPLSKRELEVLKMLTTDLSGPEIADEMHIALTTLRFHTRNIYGKLEVNNRRSAVRKAQEANLI